MIRSLVTRARHGHAEVAEEVEYRLGGCAGTGSEAGTSGLARRPLGAATRDQARCRAERRRRLTAER